MFGGIFFMFLCIDLKSFYSSVEAVERGLDPMTTKLVVADPDRGKGTICLAVSPALKSLGVKNRCRVYEIPNSIDYIMAPPRMKLYLEYSARIYGIYLKYFSKDDIHVYSVDEAFIDTTSYRKLYPTPARELGIKIMQDIKNTTGLRSTCGIGSNLYLAKIALDILSKHSSDFIGILDENSYKNRLWHHRPLTDFWRIGIQTQKKLTSYGLMDMYDIAHANEDMLYHMFGKDAELLIDHAWGRESVTMNDIKNYKSTFHSLSSGQVLLRDYSSKEAELIVKEMADLLCLDMVRKGVVSQSINLYVGYSHLYDINGSTDTVVLPVRTNSDRIIIPCLVSLYWQIVLTDLPVRMINISANKIESDDNIQLNLFVDTDNLIHERKLQTAVNSIKSRYGKNSILRGMNLEKHGTTIQRNAQIGGHKEG